MITPLLRSILETELHSSAVLNEEAKEYEIPPRLILMVRDELVELGYDIPKMWPGDVLSITLSEFGAVRLSPSTVH